jgi:pimeloyl-ACP methyl ester carboxylesterase
MRVVERGNGDPIVLVPGLQGRWEFHAPTVEALSRSHRVLTFSLGNAVPPHVVESGFSRILERSSQIDADADQIESALDQAQVERAVICGISYGGLPALRFAATRPRRTAALILASAPGPQFHLISRHEMYARWPRVFGPVFALETPRRLAPEVAAAFPGRAERWRFRRWQLRTMITAPISFRAMAARARAIGQDDRVADASRVSSPTLVVLGEERLDRVVKTRGTAQYTAIIDRAQTVTIAETGHLGSITRPTEFATEVDRFLEAVRSNSHDSAA